MDDNRKTLIGKQLDERHEQAKIAFMNRDIDAYGKIFSSSLTYLQPDGKDIGCSEITDDVKHQFSRLSSCDFQHSRESLEIITDDHVIETIELSAWIKLRVFLCFTRRWNIERRGRYTWKKTNGQWQVTDVVVEHEAIT